MWLEKYKKGGLEVSESKTGKHSRKNAGLHFGKPQNRSEELELELMKKEIEIARLKKGFMVKGAASEKEFVATFDKNTR